MSDCFLSGSVVFVAVPEGLVGVVVMISVRVCAPFIAVFEIVEVFAEAVISAERKNPFILVPNNLLVVGLVQALQPGLLAVARDDIVTSSVFVLRLIILCS